MMRRYRIADVALAGFTLVGLWIIFSVQAPYRLEFKEQISIFLFGADRISWYLSNPGIISSVTGDWLTQFYINGRIAAALSCLLLLLITAGLVRFHRLAGSKHKLVLMFLMIPVALEGYFITFPDYPVSAALGLAVAVWSACALAHIKDSRLSPWIYGLSVPVMFVIAGGHAFTMALLLGYLKRKDAAATVICLVAGLIAMALCGRFYNLTLLHTFIWPVYPKHIIPDKGLLILQPLLILAVMSLNHLFFRIGKERIMVGVLLGMAFLIQVLFITTRDKELENVVKIGTLAYRNEWKEVKEMAGSNEPNMYRNFYWNLCGAREGRLADDLLKGRWGSSSSSLFLSTGRNDPYFSMMYFTDALLEIGDVSQATDCALLAQTVMPGHYSTRMLRRLAEIAVVTGDYAVASKYLDILSRTRNHREWARDLQESINRDEIPEQYLIWRSRTASKDHFFGQGDIRSSLKIIAQESPYNRTAIDYLLCSLLLDKNLNSFIDYYDRYYLNALDRIVRVPDLYQEALMVNVNSDESLRATVEKYHISQEVVEKFMNLMAARARSENGEVLTEESVGTYWNYIMAVKLISGNQR
ncbi:MAG: hypothetical protein IKW84_08370 [Bacteroidaceae bacterium]|nr:hypothetical protein [Bacteroidaceae bacterium]